MAKEMNLSEMIEEALRKADEMRGMVNILVAGRSGVGKSTLINAVFQGNFAETGQGRPITKNVREITKDGIPVSIIDTRGLEMADFDSTLEMLEREVQFRRNDRNPGRHIHVGWVCIAEDSRRVEDAETKLTEALAKHFPIAGVITKARSDNGFKAEAQSLMPDVKNVVRVRAIHETLDDGHTIPPMGLVELIKLTNELVPEGYRNALAAAQKVDVNFKKSRCHKLIAASATAAGAVAMSPIPFSDVFLIVPVQVGMLAGISSVWGLSLSEGFLTTLVTSAAGATAASFAGRTLVANLIKFIPGGGTVAGGAISAATASALTTFLGEAYVTALTLVFDQTRGEMPSTEAIMKVFTNTLLLKKSA